MNQRGTRSIAYFLICKLKSGLSHSKIGKACIFLTRQHTLVCSHNILNHRMIQQVYTILISHLRLYSIVISLFIQAYVKPTNNQSKIISEDQSTCSLIRRTNKILFQVLLHINYINLNQRIHKNQAKTQKLFLSSIDAI